MTNLIAGVARAAMLVDLNISVYSGRKQDKATQAEVTSSKGAKSKRAASVYKSLFADCEELDAVVKYQARVRQEHYRLTKPWSDSGTRLLPTKLLTTYKDLMNHHESEFQRLVNAFLDKYDTLVSAAAFQLGTLFDRDEYPMRDEVARRFHIDITMFPLPTAGDFRLDIESQVQLELAQQYERKLEQQLADVQRDSWERLHAALTRLSDRLTVDDNGKKRVFHDTTVTGALELCDLLTAMNVTNDPQLEKARCKLEGVLSGVTAEALRLEDDTRAHTKKQVDDILSAFDWEM